MPILYSSKQKTITMILIDLRINMSQQDAVDVIMFQPQYSFTIEQAARLVFLVQRYIDPQQQSCAACGSSLRTAKDNIVKFYAANKVIIDEISTGVPLQVEEPIVEIVVAKKKSTKKK